MPDLPVGLGRRDDVGIGRTARQLPTLPPPIRPSKQIRNPQQPMRYLLWRFTTRVSTEDQLPDLPVVQAARHRRSLRIPRRGA